MGDVTPKSLPGDPQSSGHVNVSLQIPSWIYWRLVNAAETESQDVEELFYLATRALLADPSAVEAVALRKLVEGYTDGGLSDPSIASKLNIPVRRVRKVRSYFGIKSAKELRTLKTKS